MAIVLLDTKTINRIAAGEVIERPASVVKELVENAIDAKSSEIEIKIESGGRNLITAIDDGSGIRKDDLEFAFMRHATSKLSDSELIEIKYLGFRGEALPSIAAVSRIKLSSKANGTDTAWSISYEGGEKIGKVMPYSLSRGTHIEVRDLFFATPNRLKFLKTERAETQSIVDIVNNLAMINYGIGFTLTSDNKKLLKYAKQESLFSRVCEIEGEFYENSLEILEEDSIRLTGHICKPTVNRGNSTQIYTFVNGRPIKDNLLIGAIRYAYHDLIPSNRYPFAALHLEIPYDQVDVNVHPNKSEVRFQNKRLIYEIVRRGLIKVLSKRIDLAETVVTQTEITRNHLSSDPFCGSNLQNKFYGGRSDPFENQLIRQFASPSVELSERSESFNYTGMQKSQPQTEAIVLEEKQTDLIESDPLGFACCQVHNTYIIAEAKEKLIIVDQHAADERLVYECLKQKSNIKRQKLLLHEMVEIKSQAGMEMIEVYKDKLFEMGFDIEIKSENAIIVKEIPAILGAIDVKEMLIDIVDRLIETEDTLPIEDKINKILATIACHGSIRAGRKMKLEEMNELLRQIEKTPYSGQCNHGRPTYIEMKLSDIEKLFERR
ncbi:DNA mismatch repair endonuclease MutL [Wolbachia endosymbiont of Diaphorina citri]|jgi:DNA mismatch repair protein MutL|uniref:DNA mismatch repair endonuclease MutL n=1 Tax=Wolbachia endosymbiont of Diaphorina citri TaxID=116598 RepID=UPI0002D900A9|nr:DNA mismatch repair endonuclease MutL [Wolbachia endosymbiont of Diaphorina citri]QJT94248.1 DNA mismatch repair endonuclease MutL [Wolbachia endosymbiont of Diaphorina citri]QJT95489.1 DNA mismatch repair endonuclease MutL [Wolbachia endosymbiont of Diaphorina citri]QJT96850.1 DNA mismatch repair endonuclease MutL [Wolbachia endosymbiont of Diaphorina citri]QLK11145.1 DNA mismatch repair endonuclease MutL [Wolbachia endosymbiont of Diaphorina citri]QXY87322.1 DNA mismatch repair endonuclea